MPFLNIYIHLVWATKNREPLLLQEVRQQVFNHISENAGRKGIRVDCINGYSDHVHCLISLTQNQTIAKVVQLLKGESSRWINSQKLLEEHFEWQDEYFAISVSESVLPRVRQYIQKQEQHHQQQSFEEEYRLLQQRLPRL